MSKKQATASAEKFMKGVRLELDAFERREREFSSRDRKDRASELNLDVIKMSKSGGRLLPTVTPSL